MPIREGDLLWEPPADLVERANLTRYRRWLEETRGLTFDSYEALWRWSVEDLEGFWGSIWDFYDVRASRPYTRVLAERKMPGARWFEGAELNFAEHALRHGAPARTAIVARSEARAPFEVSWADLHRQVAAIAAWLRRQGVGRGDRVAAYLPNVPESVAACLAATSLGATWSSCSPDFGARSVLDRLQQIEPKVLLTIDGYRYGGRDFDRMPVVHQLQASLPTLRRTALLPYLDPTVGPDQLDRCDRWPEPGPAADELRFEQVPADHPLWILYTSGTTGMPKGIVHGHGGVLVTLLAHEGLHYDLGPEDRFFWFSTTGWVMWNALLASLLHGATIIAFDGSPGHPSVDRLWELAEETGITVFGTSAAYLSSCVKAGLDPGRDHDLAGLRAVSYTGSPLPPEHFGWAVETFGPRVWFSGISGGTDIAAPWVGSVPTLPLRAGEMPCRCLGCAVQAFDGEGRAVMGEVGELVVTEPLPSMPLHLWNDPDGRREYDSYFAEYPGVWRHGDWIKLTPEGGVVIYGRSDSTINRMGVRMGSAEIYRVVEDVPEILDSLVVDLTELGHQDTLALFVVPREGVALDAELEGRVRSAIRDQLSPRHVPDRIVAIAGVPRTLSGKKLEVPVRRLLLGEDPERVINRDAMANPETLEPILAAASDLRAERL
jgi:acetoacetyl-CoA synthetase